MRHVFRKADVDMSLTLNTKYLNGFVSPDEYACTENQVKAAAQLLRSKSGPGSDFLGWMDLPENYDKEEYARIKKAATKIQKSCDVFIVIGIGGSYLGARAVIEFLKSPLYNNMKKDTPDIYFSGCNISATCHLRGQGRLHQRYLKIWYHHRACGCFPRVQRYAREEIRR